MNSEQQRRQMKYYGAAITAPLVSLLARFVLAPILGETLPYITFFPAIVLSAMYAGLLPGLLSTVLSAALALYFVIPPLHSLVPPNTPDALGLGLFLFVGASLSWMSESSRRSRQRAEDAENVERRERLRFKQTLASIGDAVIATDADARVQFMNNVAEHLTGWSVETARGSAIGAVFKIENEETRAPVDNPIHRVLKEGVTIGLANHTVLVGKDNVRRPIEDSGAPIRNEDGKIIGAVLVFHDVTERRRAEQERDRFFTLGLDMMVVANFDGYFCRVSPSWTERLGWTSEELTSHPWLHFVHPEDQAATVEVARKLFEGTDAVAFDNRYRAKNGSWRWIRWNCRTYPDEKLIYGAATDVTEQREAAEEVQRLNATLEATVAERTRQLEDANRELEAFSYSVSHDLRAPLRSVAGFAEMLEREYDDKLDETARDYIRRMTAASHRMAQLIEDLLKLSRLSRVSLTRRPIDLANIARKIADEFHDAQPERLVKVTVQDGLVAEADNALIRVAMENLIGNAWKFTAKERVAVIDIGGYVDNGQQIFFVKDNGAGFDMRHSKLLFVPFQRLPNYRVRGHWDWPGDRAAYYPSARRKYLGRGCPR